MERVGQDLSKDIGEGGKDIGEGGGEHFCFNRRTGLWRRAKEVD